MNTGMLWFDDNKATTLESKVRRAADYFRIKYGRDPNVCIVNGATPGALELETVDEIALDTAPNVLPGHFWIGRDD